MVLCLLAAVAAQAADPKPDPSESDFLPRTLKPFLKTHCFDCHSGSEPEGGVGLDQYDSTASITDDRKTWEKVLHMVRSRQMPPEDMTRPKESEFQSVTEWLEDTLFAVDCSGPVDPGRVTIRRLNRAEYANTIRDLLGVRYEAAADFPGDDVGYGFDNIGDVLSLPPILMEKYLAAAAEIADRAIVTSELDAAQKADFSADGLAGGSVRGDHRMLASSGEIHADYRCPSDGEYLIRIRSFAQQAGDEPAKMELRIDSRKATVFEVKAEESEPAVYELRTEVKAGRRRVAAAFINDYYNPKAPDPADRDRNLAVANIEILGPLGLEPEDYPESHRKIFFVMPGEGLSEAEAARQIVDRLASRAYRRPVTEDELKRFLELGHMARQQGDSLEEAGQLVLQALLVSPHFLFRVELDPPPEDKDQIRELSDYELATRMSYFLWSSMPDDELFGHAAEGKLRENLESQVRRMLADPKAEALVDNFALQWLGLRNLDMVTPDKGLFPTFDDTLREAMRTETKIFFGGIIREDRSVLDLIDADYSFLNEPLAAHYGIRGVKGPKFRRVSLAGTPRGGVVTQASVLTVTSNPTRTSPVKRGKWILDNILGEPPPDPPPGVPQLAEDEQAVSSGSLRERLEQHRSKETCAVCHRKMDALGFAMENFDAVGAWRTRDGEFEIDPSGVLPEGQTFKGPAELKAILLTNSRESFVRCLAEKMLTYALGRGLEYYDRCAVDDIVKALAENDYKFSTLILEIVKSDPFQKRRGKGSDS
jgi:hypothetical protein